MIGEEVELCEETTITKARVKTLKDRMLLAISDRVTEGGNFEWSEKS